MWDRESRAAAFAQLARQDLSPREAEILRLVGEGKSNREIASALGIGEQTVKQHVTSLLRKLDPPPQIV
jgi:RNA polymerase sigma factor (sigma-70 family)